MALDALRERLLAALSQEEPDRDELPPGASAVLVPVVGVADEPHLLFTRRSRSLGSHPGQISFPGGRVDPEDDGPREAALRENHEEVGVLPDEVDLLGHLTEYETHWGTLISVYVGLVPGAGIPAHPASEEEVDEVFLVPLEGLLAPAGEDGAEPRPSPFPFGPDIYDVVAYEGRKLRGDTRRRNVVHYWHLVGDTTVWGITGEVIARLLDQVHGWSPPEKAREIDTLEDFRTLRPGA